MFQPYQKILKQQDSQCRNQSIQKSNNIQNQSEIIKLNRDAPQKKKQSVQQIVQKQIQQTIILETNFKPENDHVKLKAQYYNFFKNIIPDPQNYIPQMPSDEQFKKHKIKYLKGNQFHQKLHSYDKPYIRIKNTQRQATIINYTVIIGMFQLQITLLNINKDINHHKIIQDDTFLQIVPLHSEQPFILILYPHTPKRSTSNFICLDICIIINIQESDFQLKHANYNNIIYNSTLSLSVFYSDVWLVYHMNVEFNRIDFL